MVSRLAEAHWAELMTIRAVLFDLGGTLLHYHDAHSDDPRRHFRRVMLLGVRELLDQLAAEGARIPSEEQTEQTVDRHVARMMIALQETQGGGSIEGPIRAALAEVGLGLDDARWAALRMRLYTWISGTVSARIGVRETLETLRTAYLLGLISNSNWAADLHDQHLAEYGLLDALPVRIYSCDMPHMKPHPSIFQAALDRLGVTASESVYVGDRPDIDVAGAQRAGLRGILIWSPYEDTPLDGYHPDAIVEELPELPAALERWR